MNYHFSWRQPLIPRRDWPVVAQLLEGLVQWLAVICVLAMPLITWRASLAFLVMTIIFHLLFSLFLWTRSELQPRAKELP